MRAAGRSPDADPMEARFCANCGGKLANGANFCVECGEPRPGAKPRRLGLAVPTHRYAPLLVILAVVAIGGGAVVLGVLSPKVPPSVPRREASQAAGDAAARLPENHPPIAIPEQVKQAMREMAQRAQAAPDNSDIWKHLAEAQYRAGQLEPSYLVEAAAAYQHVLEREPENLDVIRNLGNIAFDREQSDVAIEYYQRYLKQKPDDLNVQTDLGTMYFQAGKTDQAIQSYESVLKTDPSFFQAQFNLFFVYRAANQPEKAMAALEKARSLAPDDTSRNQVEQVMARAKGLPPPAPAAGAVSGASPEKQPAAPVPAGTFQADAEDLFRQHPILGPKVQRIQWQGAETAQVYLRGFPMDQMGDDMRNMFIDRMRGRIKEKKAAHNVTQTARFDLVDDASGQVLATITE
jgi:tetratricopeptide (TPR) repeat protein